MEILRISLISTIIAIFFFTVIKSILFSSSYGNEMLNRAYDHIVSTCFCSLIEFAHNTQYYRRAYVLHHDSVSDCGYFTAVAIYSILSNAHSQQMILWYVQLLLMAYLLGFIP